MSDARQAQADANPIFLERRSTRAFSPDPLEAGDLEALLEAARWAPSANNEQPWIFLVATEPDELATFRSLLVEANRRWAADAPVLAFLLARRHFVRDGRENRWAAFDAGAAWMSLALQATMRGLAAHAMGGFDRERVHEVLGVPREGGEVMAAVAIGRPGDPAALPPDLRERERPTPRRPLAEVARQGRY